MLMYHCYIVNIRCAAIFNNHKIKFRPNLPEKMIIEKLKDRVEKYYTAYISRGVFEECGTNLNKFRLKSQD